MTHPIASGVDGELPIFPLAERAGGIRVLLSGETVWLAQALMAELFQTAPQNITQHLKAIYSKGELDEVATCKDDLHVRQEGARRVSRRTKRYRLEASLAVGYRVRASTTPTTPRMLS